MYPFSRVLLHGLFPLKLFIFVLWFKMGGAKKEKVYTFTSTSLHLTREVPLYYSIIQRMKGPIVHRLSLYLTFTLRSVLLVGPPTVPSPVPWSLEPLPLLYYLVSVRFFSVTTIHCLTQFVSFSRSYWGHRKHPILPVSLYRHSLIPLLFPSDNSVSTITM